MFEVLREDLAAASPAFAVFEASKVGFEEVVGPVYKAKSPAALGRDSDGMSPKKVAVGFEMGQDDVDGPAFVFFA